MAINFPNLPTPGQEFLTNGKVYVYDGVKNIWRRYPSAWVGTLPVKLALAGFEYISIRSGALAINTRDGNTVNIDII
jgi:hypothetical protein